MTHPEIAGLPGPARPSTSANWSRPCALHDVRDGYADAIRAGFLSEQHMPRRVEAGP
jgi:hypothetical protein